MSNVVFSILQDVRSVGHFQVLSLCLVTRKATIIQCIINHTVVKLLEGCSKLLECCPKKSVSVLHSESRIGLDVGFDSSIHIVVGLSRHSERSRNNLDSYQNL